MAQAKFSEIDEYGFKRSENFDYQMYERFMSDYLKVLAKRQQKWEEFLAKNSDITHIDSTLKRYIRKGIPSSKRCDIWMKISGAGKFQKEFPNRYRELVEEEPEKSLKDSIIIDLPRTFPDNQMFNTQKEQLYNILIAFAHSNKAIGYCQGLNYIAGLLLLVTKDEEKSFWLLKVIVEKHVPNYHTSKMENLLRDLAVFKELVIRRIPEVNRHIENLGLPYAVIASKWFICLFAEVLPVETVLRLWDCVFSEGYKILFRAALAVFITHKNKILECDDIAALSTIFREHLMTGETTTNCHKFIESMFKIRLTRSEIESLRKKCVGRNDT